MPPKSNKRARPGEGSSAGEMQEATPCVRNRDYATRKAILMGSEAEIFDGEIFEVKEIVAVQSGVLKQMVEDGCTAGEIPIDNVDALTLAKIIKWCNKHHNDEGKGHVLSEEEEKEKEMELKKWESEFIDELNYDELYFILTGSNYMNVKELLG
ncbi:hypothetical protein Q3G72_000879 [Acer saccharum]|nr:hypothetical protein Q3G72_000879 [Acer saccharum]